MLPKVETPQHFATSKKQTEMVYQNFRVVLILIPVSQMPPIQHSTAPVSNWNSVSADTQVQVLESVSLHNSRSSVLTVFISAALGLMVKSQVYINTTIKTI